MKKSKKVYFLSCIIAILFVSVAFVLFGFNKISYAAPASGNLSVSSSSVYVGDNFTVSVNINSVAAWNVHVSSTGPVSGCVINQADATSDALDTNKTFSATCTATATGTITVKLSGDVTSASDGNPVSITGSKSVNVSTRPVVVPSNNNNKNGNNSGNTNATNVDNRSTNNKLKELSVDGFKLEKVDDNNYKLDVHYGIESINVKASAEDSKAKISGDGAHQINIGSNDIEVVVTSESGTTNVIHIIVNRRDAYYLDDLDTVLSDNKIKNVNIKITDNSKVTVEDMDKIKNARTVTNLEYYGQSNDLVYSWIIDGSKIKKVEELDTKVTFKSNYSKEISKISNYADGMYIHFKDAGDFPRGTKIKIYVGDKFSNKEKLNVYYYDKDNNLLKYVIKGVEVENGFVVFNVSKGSDYFISMSVIDGLETVPDNSENSLVPILFFVFTAVVFVLSIVIFIVRRKNVNDNSNEDKDNSVE